MYTVTLNAPNNQSDGSIFVDEIDLELKSNELKTNRKYFIYREIVTNPNINLAVQNFKLTLQFENIFRAICISRMFNGIISTEN